MKKFLMISAAVLTFGLTSQAWALTANDLVTAYQNDGFTAIEVTTGLTQIKVEAVKDGTRLEVVYDIATGDILKKESSAASAEDASSTAVEVKTSKRDFTGDDEDEGEDDHGGNSGASDDGADHDAGDDHGGDSGSDDDGGDDHGSDHSGSDHSGSDSSGHDGGDDDGED